MRTRLLLIPLSLIVLFAGCALSPQRVALYPAANIEATPIGHNQPLVVVAEDLRENKVIGTRGGIYADTSLIRASNRVAKELAAEVRRYLQGSGFNTLNANASAARLAVQLVRLDYTPAKGYVVNRVVVAATLRAELTRVDGSVYTRTYSSQITFEQPITPTAERNQEMLTEVLNRSLNKLLHDALLLQQLQALTL